MEMTHYMELLSTNQPWNLLIYMAIPVILAETLAIAELYLLFTNKTTGRVRTISKVAGIIAGVYFTGIFLYLMNNAFIPLTTSSGWRGVGDFIAVSMYLLGVVPLAGIALLEMNLIYKKSSTHVRRKMHAIFIGMFLVIAHVAMIFGMLSPSKLGWTDTSTTQTSAMDMSMTEMTDELKGKTGSEFDKAFLEEMTLHHQGAIEMAELAQQNAGRPELQDMAQDILDAQKAEIQQMKMWKTQWGYSQDEYMMDGHNMDMQ